MWHAFNLISEGDSVRSTTIRKVQNETATGSSTSSRVRTTLTIAVESIDFDTQACVLRLKGRNIEENQYVKMGAYHTLDLELNRKFELRKPEWDTIALERIEMACDPTQSADVAAVVMQEGLAHVCLITASMTLVRSKIEVSIPRKRTRSRSRSCCTCRSSVRTRTCPTSSCAPSRPWDAPAESPGQLWPAR